METILVLEDVEPVLNVFVSVLQKHGYTVLEAKTAEEARRILGGDPKRIDALIANVVLPGMSGAQFAAELIRISPRIENSVLQWNAAAAMVSARFRSHGKPSNPVVLVSSEAVHGGRA